MGAMIITEIGDFAVLIHQTKSLPILVYRHQLISQDS